MADYRTEVLADSPIVFLELDEASGTIAADEIGSHPGTYVNTPTFGVTGPVTGKTAVAFDKTASERVVIDTLGTLGTNLLTNTYELWIKTTEAATACIFGMFNTGTSEAVQVLLNRSSTDTLLAGSTMFFIRGTDGKQTRAAITTNIYDGAWHHMKWVIASSTTFQVRIDKVDATPTYTIQQAPATFANFEFPLSLAARNLRGTFDNYGTMSLSHFAAYAARLSDARSDAHFNAAATVAAPGLNDPITASVGERFRLRMELQETAGVAFGDAYKLQVSKNGAAYADVVSGSGDVRIVDSPQFTHGGATANLLPVGSGVFVAGQGLDTSATSGSISLSASGHTEIEWSLILNSATAGNTFDFRTVRSDGTLLNVYGVTPRVTAT